MAERKEDLKQYKTDTHHASYDATVDVGVEAKATCRVVGGFIAVAVAWFTNFAVLDALAEAIERGVAVMVVVQKEDFLRPDSTTDKAAFARALRQKYDALGTVGVASFLDIGTIVLQYAKPFIRQTPDSFWFGKGRKEETTPAVRCVGNHNSTKNPSCPRMHNKFFVFGKTVDKYSVKPEIVWTGSYNCSKAAENSFENAVILTSSEIAKAYTQEFALLFLLSEPLNWTSEWMQPEAFYGT